MSGFWTVRPPRFEGGGWRRHALTAAVPLLAPALLVLMAGNQAAIGAERPATRRPSIGDRLPETGNPLRTAGGPFAFPTSRPARTPRNVLGAGGVSVDLTPRRSKVSGFSDLLIDRMHREYHRLDQQQMNEISRPNPVWVDIEDSQVEERRSMYAERILTNAIDKTIDQKLILFARTTAGLGDAWDWFENLGDRTRTATNLGSLGQSGGAAAPGRPSRFGAGFGFKVAMRPRVLLKARFFDITGQIDVPLRDEPLTVTLQRRLGTRTHLKLTGVARHESMPESLNLTLRLGF